MKTREVQEQEAAVASRSTKLQKKTETIVNNGCLESD